MTQNRHALEEFKQFPVVCGQEVVSKSGDHLFLYRALLQNRSGATVDAAIIRGYGDDAWKAFSLVALDTPDATEITTEIQANTPTTLFSANNDGLLIGAKDQFHSVTLNASTAATGSPVFTLEYYNGTAYVTLPSIKVITGISLTQYAETILFAAPLDWEKGTTVAVGGETDQYNMKLTATTAPTVKPIVTEIIVGKVLAFQEALADNGNLEIIMDNEDPIVFEANDFLTAYFATANPNNLIQFSYA